MKSTSLWMRAVSLCIALLLSLSFQAMAQQGDDASQTKLSKEELAQLLAPIALYPDELVAQILMASTYPLEIVQADRWAKSHAQSAGDTLAKQLEKENWDPSVKSLVNFPTVLAKMSEKLDLTTKIGDAFLSQQKDVMETIQDLRKKAYEAGNLKTTKEQKIVVEKEVIVIQPANPEVVYVPTYSPTVVYGTWMYPAYPPYYYYPPPPPAYPAYSFAAGVAVGVAWGYAWGNTNWHGNNVYVNHNQNVNINNKIDRSKYKADFDRRQGGRGNNWQHDPSHRKGVAYKDKATAKNFGQSSAKSLEGRRDARGYGDAGGKGAGARPSAGTMDRGGRAGTDRSATPRASTGDAREGGTALSAVPAVAGRNGWQVTGARQAARVPAEQASAAPPEGADSAAALPGGGGGGGRRR